MHIWLAELLLLLIASNIGWAIKATSSCKTDNKCPVSSKMCAMCIQGNGPPCTTPICINGQCGEIDACSLQLNGACASDTDCVSIQICARCMKNMGPDCAQARCISGQCATISPCSIQLSN